ncbi:bifunctional DNA-binding transcriptional regulator/O6-methylguanine-DNA methyltransferase Ada [Pontixanthobacter aestiaquae]|uniref:methylated-DNA--[protein]-cysteine S-methyltransferase n=1 Tax=Pontixanthobacter aestiaquae TaxID=1509367 RepID=A0A844ZE94_9SPHN|nr:bifunctional DNA-binding transcriptional regulator/O6-methylguanine-DNA methyltransferase Ada [Pontixanthobacter aestiaquae]MDN3644910.1 bifunctional DNA-binding transcriptional regulator/O6-methylguanine-DNA methyltransferase Ada [Pontixanthobacter aestiaquae]MXO84089.1 bifunctional DNA-binding transcriptional regulator/O6-methylguanine-DNA methyltransferase Ada [Pontixanthobacter aestiaquae]
MAVADRLEPQRPDADMAWEAFMRRDRSFDGRFVGAVRTTGIYCKPSCPVRHPKRENVEFFFEAAEARTAGFRACMRCRPDDLSRDREAVVQAICLIERAGGTIRLDKLAAEVGYAPHHFHRLFKRDTGLTPAQFGRSLKSRLAEGSLRSGTSVTDAIYGAGFSAPSRFYDTMEGRLGMSPSAWKNGGKDVAIHWAVVDTYLGKMLVAATEKGVCRLSFNESESDLAERFPSADLIQGGDDFSALLSDVIAAVETPGDARHIPLDVQGTAFQEAVWQELRKIPPGETRSYAEIAAAAGNPKAVRATGSANGANTVAVLIPCHRVVRSDGSLGGYAYGTNIKEELLKREAKQ